jgi:hypothetical protein
MLTDVALKNLKSKEKPYKVADRDGMYVVVAPSGTVTFRLDYRLNGRRETVTFGQYGPAELSLARAREMTIDARRSIMEGKFPCPRKAACKAADQRGEELRRIWGKVAFHGDDGRQHPRYAPRHFRTGAGPDLQKSPSARNHV